jgi:hypothetical protein
MEIKKVSRNLIQPSGTEISPTTRMISQHLKEIITATKTLQNDDALFIPLTDFKGYNVRGAVIMIGKFIGKHFQTSAKGLRDGTLGIWIVKRTTKYPI